MLGVLVSSPLLLAGAGAVIERALRVRDRNRFPAPAKMQDVGGHSLHYDLRGEGDPVVVFETDTADWSTHWNHLADRLSQHTTILTYDRAGLGWSQPGPEPRTVDTLARELHQLLHRLTPGRQVLIVGHGTGASAARMFGHRYPFETAGLVLLDPPHEGLWDKLRHDSIQPPHPSGLILRALGLANSIGLLRALKVRPALPPLGAENLAARGEAILIARGHDPQVLGAIQAEERARPQSEAQLEELRDRFEFPVRALVAGATLHADSVGKGYPVDEFNRMWVEQAQQFAELSSDARVEVIEGAHHHLPLGEPDAVERAVLEVLEAARAAAPAP